MRTMKVLQILIISMIVSSVNGQVILTDIPDTTIYVGDSLYIDLNNDQVDDYLLTCFDAGGGMYRANICELNSNSVASSQPWVGSFGYYVTKFIENESINSSLYWNGISNCDYLYSTAYEYEYHGFFNGAIDAFIGLNIVAGNNYYGWIQVDVSSSADWITIKGYAYNSTPNSPITTQMFTGINKFVNNIEYEIYPNPTTDKLFVKYFGINSEIITLNIYNAYGKLVIRRELENEDIIDLQNLENGFYFIEMYSENLCVTEKILKI